jgi:hypothetical protein
MTTITVRIEHKDVEDYNLIESEKKHGVLMTPKDMENLLNEPLCETVCIIKVLCGVEILFQRTRLPIYA